MKRLLATAGLAAVLAAPALAQDGWYVTGGVGYGWMPDNDILDTLNNTSAEVDAEGDLRFMLGLGYEFTNNWRVQLDAMDRFNDTGAPDDIGPASTDFQNVAVMGSLIYDFENATRFTPYVGGGVGYSQTEFSGLFNGGETVQADGRGISYQALAGLDFGLTDRISALVEARYFYGPDVEFVSLPGGFPGETDAYESYDVLFGLRYSFGAAPAPVAPPPVERTPAPAPTCSDVPFVVYFEFDQSTLTDQARQVIARASQQAAECDITRVEIEGHTDRSGSQAYNARLSERRARVVRDELIRLGVAASLISIEARGESEPAVATPDGAREPLNRRTEVVIRTR